MKLTNTSSLTISDAFKLGTLDAHSQAELITKGELSSADLVSAARLRIEKLNPSLNAVSWLGFDRAMEKTSAQSAQSSMAGVPYLLKDGLDYPGMPALSGSRFRKNHPYTAKEFAYTKALDQAGLIVLGKTNATEFGLLPTTEPIVHGIAHNPWALGFSTGGSSGGAAAAVAAGMVPLAHAADGGGSIRIPASCCHVVGMKPGRAANLRARAQYLLDDFLVGDSLLGRTVRDVAWGINQCHPSGNVPTSTRSQNAPFRIAVVMDNLMQEAPDPAVEATIRMTADLCANLGYKVEYKALPVDGSAVMESFKTLWAYVAYDVVSGCENTLQKGKLSDNLEPWTLDLARWSQTQDVEKLEAAFVDAAKAISEYNNFFDTWDVILSPVLKKPPVAIGELGPARPFSKLFEQMFDYVSYTPLHNITGAPSISLPMFMQNDCAPIGSLFSAKQGNEALLLELAAELEKAAPWHTLWPATSAGHPPPDDTLNL